MLGVRIYGRGTGSAWLILIVGCLIFTNTTPAFWLVTGLLAAVAIGVRIRWSRVPTWLLFLLAVPVVAVALVVTLNACRAIATSIQQHGLASTLSEQWHNWGSGALIVAIVAVPLGGLFWLGLKMKPKPLPNLPPDSPPDFPAQEQLSGGGPIPPSPARWSDRR